MTLAEQPRHEPHDPDRAAYVVEVRHAEAQGSPLVMLYAALAESPGKAVELVREAVEPDAEVSITDAHLSTLTALAIGLMPDYAIPL